MLAFELRKIFLSLSFLSMTFCPLFVQAGDLPEGERPNGIDSVPMSKDYCDAECANQKRVWATVLKNKAEDRIKKLQELKSRSTLSPQDLAVSPATLPSENQTLSASAMKVANQAKSERALVVETKNAIIAPFTQNGLTPQQEISSHSKEIANDIQRNTQTLTSLQSTTACSFDPSCQGQVAAIQAANDELYQAQAIMAQTRLPSKQEIAALDQRAAQYKQRQDDAVATAQTYKGLAAGGDDSSGNTGRSPTGNKSSGDALAGSRATDVGATGAGGDSQSPYGKTLDQMRAANASDGSGGGSAGGGGGGFPSLGGGSSSGAGGAGRYSLATQNPISDPQNIGARNGGAPYQPTAVNGADSGAAAGGVKSRNAQGAGYNNAAPGMFNGKDGAAGAAASRAALLQASSPYGRSAGGGLSAPTSANSRRSGGSPSAAWAGKPRAAVGRYNTEVLNGRYRGQGSIFGAAPGSLAGQQSDDPESNASAKASKAKAAARKAPENQGLLAKAQSALNHLLSSVGLSSSQEEDSAPLLAKDDPNSLAWSRGVQNREPLVNIAQRNPSSIPRLNSIGGCDALNERGVLGLHCNLFLAMNKAYFRQPGLFQYAEAHRGQSRDEDEDLRMALRLMNDEIAKGLLALRMPASQRVAPTVPQQAPSAAANAKGGKTPQAPLKTAKLGAPQAPQSRTSQSHAPRGIGSPNSPIQISRSSSQDQQP